MTLEEVIKHAEEKAEELRNEAEHYEIAGVNVYGCEECAKEHDQLVEWLKELKDYRERMPSYETGYNDAKREIALSGEYERAYERGKSDAEQTRWIPVSEKLPEFRKEVLTCSNGGFIEIQSLEDSYDGYWENQKGDWTDLEEITAWMPLPEPFKMSGFPTDCSNLDSCENCKYDDGECCRLLYEAKMESEDKE